uniref:F-box/LRR-repeat MAX2 homolog A n=1 Tax=Tanacetum cinerariifolium TaxID=118510 RepID=A0A6L2K053_TANCI|nr:F-box/LRR-repeat MAX2 homolog A [Tanacetum cinerariifolium]
MDLVDLDLSSFYCWTDDVPIVLRSFPLVASRLTCLNLLNPSIPDGFKGEEVEVITKCCLNLKKFLIVCLFNPSYVGFVGDEMLGLIPVNCPKLSVLCLANLLALVNARVDPETQGFSTDDASIIVSTLIEMFSGLPLLEEFMLDICHNIRDSGPVLEILNSKCLKLKCLKIGNFHGISMPIESKLDGVALCRCRSGMCKVIFESIGANPGSDTKRKKQKLDFDLNDFSNGFQEKTWEKLEHLSLWFLVGELLTPLLSSGFKNYPNLEEMFIKIESDCRYLPKPAHREFELRSLALYPKLSKMKLDCGDTASYAHTAPSGHIDLSLWERFYLFGIGDLSLVELDYWPP